MSGNPTNLEYIKCFLHYLKGYFSLLLVLYCLVELSDGKVIYRSRQIELAIVTYWFEWATHFCWSWWHRKK